MTDLAMSPDVQALDDTDVFTTEAVQTSTLITEHEVLIGSTAALTAPAVRRHGFRASLRALFASTEKADRPEKAKKHRNYPSRNAFMEDAAMSRAMYRL